MTSTLEWLREAYKDGVGWVYLNAYQLKEILDHIASLERALALSKKEYRQTDE